MITDMPAAWMIAGIASVVGGAMGLLSLIMPRWGASVVRLAPDPRWKGGWAEFRASYGGAILFAHIAVLMTLAMSAQAGAGSVIGASFAVSLYWIGMAIGRIVSMIVDHKERETITQYNLIGTGFEAVMGLSLAAPFLAHLS